MLDEFESTYKTNLLKHASKWYKSGHKKPISVYFEQQNIKDYAEELSKYVFDKCIANIDGPVFHFPTEPSNLKKITLKIGD
jgi:hypothetical protein